MNIHSHFLCVLFVGILRDFDKFLAAQPEDGVANEEPYATIIPQFSKFLRASVSAGASPTKDGSLASASQAAAAEADAD